MKTQHFLMTVICLVVPLKLGPAQGLITSVGGLAVADQVGRSAVMLPDVNGDGVADWAAGSPLRTTILGIGTGAVEVRSGQNGSLILLLQGFTAGERFGSALGTADVNGDGVPDLLVGAPLAPGIAGATGRVTAHALPLGSTLLTLEGLTAGDQFGAALVGVKDLQGDGRDEILVGAPFFDGPSLAQCGRVSMHSGATGFELSAFVGTGAFDRLGESVSYLGDVNFDWIPDVVVGAPGHNGPAGADAGRAYILSGGLTILGTLDGAQAGDRFGSAVLGCPDLDGDGRPDVVVGSEFADGPGGSNSGRIDAINAVTLGNIWTRVGATPGELLGAALAGGGDQDGDLFHEIIAAAPLFDGVGGFDSGRCLLLGGADGNTLYSVEGQSPGEQLGFAVAGGRDIDGDGRPDALFCAPFATFGGTAQAGRVETRRLDPPTGRIVSTYAVGETPTFAQAADADGDGDPDLLVLCPGDHTVHVLWNGNHAVSGPNHGRGIFSTIAPTVLALDTTATPTSLVVAQFDGDAVIEFAVGRSDGRVQVFDGLGNTAAPVFASQQILVLDNRPTPGAVASLATVQAGTGATLVAAIAGTLVTPGQARLVQDPLGVGTVHAPLLTGGSFVGAVVCDLDQSGNVDLVLTNGSVGPMAGVNVLLGPNFTPAPGSPFLLTGIAVQASAAALDPDNIANDVLVAQIGFAGGGAQVLPDFASPSGFSGLVSTAPFQAARCIAAPRRENGSVGAVLADGLGRVFSLDDWNGTGFLQVAPFPVGEDVVHLITAQLTTFDGQTICNADEVAAVVRSEGVVRVVRQGIASIAQSYPSTGCPFTAPTALIGTNGPPILGNFGFGITLSNSAPSTGIFLAAQANPAPGTPPFLAVEFTCGFILFPTEILLLPWSTTPAGTAFLPAALPPEPLLLCAEFALQWVIPDGGPLGGLTLSNALLLRIGEY